MSAATSSEKATVRAAFSALLSDMRFGARLAWRNPTLSLSVVATLALGLGTLGGVGLIANRVLNSSLPGAARGDELVQLRMQDARGGRYDMSPVLLRALSTPQIKLTGSGSRTFQVSGPNLQPTIARGAFVGPGYFGVLGTRAIIGRTLLEEELAPSTDSRVVVISNEMWRRDFGGDVSVVGKRIKVNAVDYEIVGVLEQNFRGLDRLRPENLWVPLGGYAALMHSRSRDMFLANALTVAIARIDGAVELAQAQREVQQRFAIAVEEFPSIRRGYAPQLLKPAGIDPGQRAQFQRALRLLLGIGVLVLLAAFANVASLLLLQTLNRRTEFGVRNALGASLARLFQQRVSELTLIGVVSGVFALGVAWPLATMLARGRIGGLPQIEEFSVSAGAGAIVFGGSLLTALAAGVITSTGLGWVPAFGAVQSGGRYSSVTKSARAILSVVQVAASMALLVGAITLMRAVAGLDRIPLGFEPQSLHAYVVSPAQQGYTADRQLQLQNALLRFIENQPGIQRVAVTSAFPLSNRQFGGAVMRPGTPEGQGIEGSTFEVSPQFFDALAIPFINGHTFAASDLGVGAVVPVILSEDAATRLFGSENPIGRDVECCTYGGGIRRVVGIVRNARLRSLRESSEPTMYIPAGSKLVESLEFSLLVKSSLAAPRTDSLVRRALQAIDPNLPTTAGVSISRIVKDQFIEERVLMWLVGCLATIVTVLAGVGLYGVLSQSVAYRTREIGVRMALGSSAVDVAGLVVRQFLALLAPGIAIGLFVGGIVARVISLKVHGVAGIDVLSVAAAAVALMIVGIVACAIPARRASAVDPATALRTT